VGSVHALQAVVLLAIATAASLPITASFLIGPPGAGDYGSASLGSVRIDWLFAAFLLLAAVDHLTLSGGRPCRWYEANVARGINPACWWEVVCGQHVAAVPPAWPLGGPGVRRAHLPDPQPRR
jgi:Heliorhodopsin